MSARIRTAGPLAAILAAVAMLATACGSSTSADEASAAAAQAPSEIRIAYQAVPNGDLVVKHNKWLEEALPDTKITWTKFDSGGDVNTAILGGAIDIGLVGSSPVTRGLSQPLNIPYRVPWIFDVIGSAESLIARDGAGIASVKDLAGKKVATPFASTAHYSLLAALKEAGVAETSVTLVDLQPQDILAAWQRGDIDAAYVWSPTLDELKKNGTVLITSQQLAEKGYPTYDLAVVTNEFAEKYPAALSTWIQQQNRAVQQLQDDQAKAAQAIAAELGLTAEEVKPQLEGLVFLTGEQQQAPEYFGTPQAPGQFAAGLLKAAEFLKSQQKIDAVPSLETLQAGIDVQALADALGQSK